LLRPRVEKSADLVVEVPNAECPVAMPRWQLIHLVTSLVSNSLEALASHERADAQIALRLLRHEERGQGIAEIHVTDNGPGMPAHVRFRAMEPLFSTRGADRAGLGLALARARVQRAGGELLIDSGPGMGTCVQVFLPIQEVVSGPQAFGD